MTFDQIRLEVKYLSDNMTFINGDDFLIKLFCSDVISGKVISTVEFKVYSQVGRNDPVTILDWTVMDGTLSPIYEYIISPVAWATTTEGRIDVKVTYADNTSQEVTLPYKFEVED